MPEILIRMEMPKNEPLRLVLNPNGQLFVDHGVTFTEYEAVELPPHGDLIDRDELNKCRKESCHGKNGWEYDYVEDLDIDKATVIVPSNKEETK